MNFGQFLACSAYKFFGPHQGILWGRREVLETLEPYKVRPAPSELPWCFESGTQSHEGMAGTAATVDYFAWIGETMSATGNTANSRRHYVTAGLDLLLDYEQARERVYGMPYSDWKAKYQTPATAEQLADYDRQSSS